MTHTPRLGARNFGSAIGLSVCLLAPGIGTPSAALAASSGRTIELLSGGWADNASVQGARISGDGQLVTFSAVASPPFEAAGSTGLQVYATNLGTSEVEQISVGSDEVGDDSQAFGGGITPDGRFVTYSDYQHPYSGRFDTYVRDRQLGLTEIVSVADGGGPGDGISSQGDASISADGRYVVFSSSSTNLVSGDLNGKIDVFLRDRTVGTTTRLSVGDGTESNGDSYGVAISADGSTVAFGSYATNLIAGDANGKADLFVVDLGTMDLQLASISSTGGASDGDSAGTCGLELSTDGRSVVFASLAENLVPGDSNFATDIFVRDRVAETTTRVSVTDGGSQAPIGKGSYAPAMTPTARRWSSRRRPHWTLPMTACSPMSTCVT